MKMVSLCGIAAAILAVGQVVTAYNVSSVSAHCDSIWDFTGDPGFEVSIKVSNVTYVAANGVVPAYCAVTMWAYGATGILMYLPAEGKDWKGVFSSHGCGGSCGVLGIDYIYGYGRSPLGYGRDLVVRGYVTSMTDMGHQNGPNDTLSSWNHFRNNRTVEYDFAYLSTHYTAVAGKALTEYYYGTAPVHSYFRGGSTGGRQALMIAQRYPHDFDSIIVGYAASNETGIGAIHFPWLAKHTMLENGTLILNATDIPILHAGALAACDANDGVVDGIIDPTYKCDFDPVTILCSANKTTNCLSSMLKVNAIRQMYSYASNARDKKLIGARYLPGSELEWTSWVSSYGWKFAQSFTRDAAFQQDLPLNWTIQQYDWETMPYQVGHMEDIYGVGSTDLSIFRDRGGKIIHYTGWADGNVAPEWNLHYYNRVVAAMGGLEEVQKFYRFFMFPGMAHVDVSASNTIGWNCDYYDYLEDWYLNGVAPESLLVTHVELATNKTLDYRPYFPYPLTHKYVGQGAPTNTTEDVKNWVGYHVPDAEKQVF